MEDSGVEALKNEETWCLRMDETACQGLPVFSHHSAPIRRRVIYCASLPPPSAGPPPKHRHGQ